VDKNLGHMIQLDAHHRVIRAMHGTKHLDKVKINEAYKEPIHFDGVSTERYWCARSYFEMGIFLTWQQLIDKYDTTGQNFELYKQFSKDIEDSVNFNFANWKDSWYFKAFRENVGKYIEKRTNIRQSIQRIRSQSDIKLFLLTNSYEDYSQLLMEYAFGEDWKDLFDVVVYRARKPYFFGLDHPMYESVGNDKSRDPVTGLVPNQKSYCGGNVNLLNEFFETISNSNPKKLEVCYVGDDVIADITLPKRVANWTTVAVAEELEALERERGKSRKDVFEASKCTYKNDFWESFFYTDSGHLTLWGSVIHYFSDLYLPDVSRLLELDLKTEFHGHHFSSKLDASSDIKEKTTVSVSLHPFHPMQGTLFHGPTIEEMITANNNATKKS